MNHKELMGVVLVLTVLAFSMEYLSLEQPIEDFEFWVITGRQTADGLDNSDIVRSFSKTTVAPSETFTVYIDVIVDHETTTHYVYAIEENVPAGWQIQSASSSGVISGQTIKWSYVQEHLGSPVQASSTTLSYQVQAPASTQTGTWTGQWTMDDITGLQTTSGPTQVSTGTTCTPTNPSTEVCDGVDNDCDGTIDQSGGSALTQSCYTGPGGTQGIGECVSGTQTCSGGSYGTCTGQVVPEVEICDGLDNNCNGQTDEICGSDCTPGQTETDNSCGTTDVGECRYGSRTRTCDNYGNWQPYTDCIGNIDPVTEICDGLDNNCDGSKDEGFTNEDCSAECLTGEAPNGANFDAARLFYIGSKCCGDQSDELPYAATEAGHCSDSSDNDCDGLYDSDDPDCAECTTDAECADAHDCTVDTCSPTTHTCEHVPDNAVCSNGIWCDGIEECDTATGCQSVPHTGIDDGVDCTDDDCNEVTHEFIHTPMDSWCAGDWCDGDYTCNPVTDCQLAPRDCSDTYGCTDDTCDETNHCLNTENDVNCPTGETCSVDYFGGDGCGELLACTGQPDGTACDDGNYCNGLDECQSDTCVNVDVNRNCDDGIACTADICNEVLNSCMHPPIDSDSDGFDQCNGSTYDCDDSINTVNPNATEICTNSRDDDCDGLSDTSDPDCFSCTNGETRYCPKQAGVCDGIQETCTSGTWSGCDYNVLSHYQSRETTCDNRDNDCDGSVDEGCGGGGGGGGGGGTPTNYTRPVSCKELWSCTSWNECNTRSTKTRTCTDQNNCSTVKDKPSEIMSCQYSGDCSDGLMNDNELGIDCGGRCTVACTTIPLNARPSIEITAEPLEAEILDWIDIPITIKNIGEKQAEQLKLSLNKWILEPHDIDLLLPGQEKTHIFKLSIPADPSVKQIIAQVIYKNSPIATKEIPVNLLVPKYSIKFIRDSETNKLHPVIIFDNRNGNNTRINVQYSIEKDGESYVIDTLSKIPVNGQEVFQRTENTALKSLPAGTYEVRAQFFESGSQVGESIDSLVIEGDKTAINFSFLFYIMIIGIIVAFVYFLVIYKPKRGE